MSYSAAEDVTPRTRPQLTPVGPRPVRSTDRGGPPAVDPLIAHLDDIATSNRVLANRIAELEAEVDRQSAVAERLRQNLASAIADDMSACADELAAMRATRLFRWSAKPRQVYRQLRTTSGRRGQQPAARKSPSTR